MKDKRTFQLHEPEARFNAIRIGKDAKKVMNNFSRMAGSVFAVVVLMQPAQTAHAAEIKVLSALGIKAAMDDLVPRFERASGHRLAVTFAPLGAMVKLVQGGETADVVIAPQQGMDGFIKDGKVNADSVRSLARSGMAVAVRRGTPRPDISTPEAFRHTLLAAKSITYGRGAGSEHIEKVLERLGIANDVKAKTVRGTAGDTGVRVANGEAEIGVSLLQVLMPVAGIDIVGPLPADLQDTLVFAVATMAGSKAAAASKTLVDFLRSPEAAKIFKAKGLEPA
jgi:molybdate transport system substrate-binding protein